jgi:hypothetical protein
MFIYNHWTMNNLVDLNHGSRSQLYPSGDDDDLQSAAWPDFAQNLANLRTNLIQFYETVYHLQWFFNHDRAYSAQARVMVSQEFQVIGGVGLDS